MASKHQHSHKKETKSEPNAAPPASDEATSDTGGAIIGVAPDDSGSSNAGLTESPASAIVEPMPTPAPVPAPAPATPLPDVDFNKVWVRLFQGSAPKDPNHDYPQFTMIVLCSQEYQPDLPNFRGKVVKAGFDDTTHPTERDIKTAGGAAEIVFRELVSGGTVLVTCTAGRNRSGLVVGLVLGRKMSGEAAIGAIRSARGEYALSNPTYAELVRRCGLATPPRISNGATTNGNGNGKPKPVTYGHANGNGNAEKPGLIRSVLKTVFPSGPTNYSRGNGKKPPSNTGAGRGFYGKKRTDRTPRARGAR